MDAVTTNAAANAMRSASERMKASSGDMLASYPPLEGEGRLACSVAECETGWGDLSTRALFARRDLHPTPPRVTRASTLPLQGRVNEHSHPLHRHRNLRAVLDGLIDHAITFRELQQQVEL